ncbi:MAG: Na/Pi symporter, partial [Clostridia bacterium]
MASLASNAYFNFLAFSPNNIAVGDYFLAFAGLLGGLGAFLIGVKLMSDSISKIANRGLRKMFDKLSNNKLAGIGIGLSTTAIIQSSAVTTVMVIGFVNAGIMSLTQATAVIMGANIGTTVTAQIAALQGFDFIAYAVILTVVGIFINMLAK